MSDRRAVLLRLCVGVVVASVLAVGIFLLNGTDVFRSSVSSVVAEVHAQDDCGSDSPGEDCFVVYYPGICAFLATDSWWYSHFNCENENPIEAESVTYEPLDDGRLITRIVRDYENGERHILILQQVRRR